MATPSRSRPPASALDTSDVPAPLEAVAEVVAPPPASPLRRRRGVVRLPPAVTERVIVFDKAADAVLDRLRGQRLPDRVFYTASELGDMALAWHIVAAARGLRSERHAADALRVSAILGIESVLVNGVVKSFFRRTRPAWDQHRAFRIRKPRSSSFPSGHASAAFTAAAVLSEDDPLAPLYYAVATVIATSRAYVRIHHASDVVAGIATGVVIGRLARRWWPPPVDGNPFSGIAARRAAAGDR